MKQRLTCFCDNTLDIDVPDDIDLDSDPRFFDEIQNGTFLNFTCESCGKNHKPEFPLSVLWPSKKMYFEVFPEQERGDFYRRKKNPPKKSKLTTETIIGYPELAERLLVIRNDLDPVIVEAIKYFLFIKAEEKYPDGEMEIWYFGSNSETLEFHIHGIRENEVAVMKVPFSLYEKTLRDYRKNRKDALFTALRVKTYLSVKNTMRPEVLK